MQAEDPSLDDSQAKGGEADNVILLTETTKTCEKNDPDDEARVFYVGPLAPGKTCTSSSPAR